VAACIFGGLTLSWNGEGDPHATSLEVDEGVLPVVLVPDATLSTEVARGLLPELVPHADAAFNAGRSALLVHALTHEPAFLLEATEDRLHQPQRAAAMPGSAALVERLRAARQAAVVSGAGPSVLVLARRTVRSVDVEPGVEEVEDIAALTPPGWSVVPMDVDRRGARIDRPVRQISSS
jgi:homoserine kinase